MGSGSEEKANGSVPDAAPAVETEAARLARYEVELAEERLRNGEAQEHIRRLEGWQADCLAHEVEIADLKKKIAASEEARRYAEREGVTAKGEEARLKRELASAVTKNRDLFDTKCEAIRKEQHAKREALLYRKQLRDNDIVPRDPPVEFTVDDFDIAAEALQRGLVAAMRGVLDLFEEVGRAIGEWLQSEDGQKFLAALEETNRQARAKALDALLTPKPGDEVITPYDPATDPDSPDECKACIHELCEGCANNPEETDEEEVPQ